MDRLLFTDALIFDGSGAPPFPGEVLVTGNRIAAVAQGEEHLPRDGARLTSADGAVLMPGMVEAHAHLSFPSSVGRVVNAMHLPPEEHLLITAHNARVTLEAGFTSAFSAGSLGARFEVALKREIEAGHLPGPRLRAGSIERAPEGPPGLPRTADGGHGRGPEAVRRFVLDEARAGVENVKFLLSGDEGFSPGGSQVITYSEEEVAAAGAAAREAGIFLACHAQAAEAVKLGLRHGFRAIYHCSYADEEALDLLEARKDEVFAAPAISLLYSRRYEAEAFGITPEVAVRMGAVSGMELMQALYPKMRARGIRVLPGGDYGFPYNPIGRNARDLELFVTLLGYNPIETLVAATRHGAALMGMEDELGQIRAGFLADLLLVDGDPTQDVRLLQQPERLLMVMKDGKIAKTAPRRAIH